MKFSFLLAVSVALCACATGRIGYSFPVSYDGVTIEAINIQFEVVAGDTVEWNAFTEGADWVEFSFFYVELTSICYRPVTEPRRIYLGNQYEGVRSVFVGTFPGKHELRVRAWRDGREEEVIEGRKRFRVVTSPGFHYPHNTSIIRCY